jgi:hypothetical protein
VLVVGIVGLAEDVVRVAVGDGEHPAAQVVIMTQAMTTALRICLLPLLNGKGCER